jgi:hypothetical protein
LINGSEKDTEFSMPPSRIVPALLLAALGAAVPFCPASAGKPAHDHRDAARHLPPEEFLTYLPERYAACIPCHPRPVFEEEDFNVDTNWRDTTLGKNLHGLHVYRQPDGVNCSVCHRWDEPSGKFAFSERIRVTVKESGGACTPSCHRPKKYDNAGRIPPGG